MSNRIIALKLKKEAIKRFEKELSKALRNDVFSLDAYIDDLEDEINQEIEYTLKSSTISYELCFADTKSGNSELVYLDVTDFEKIYKTD